MAWQDRPYYRDRDSSAGNPLMWLLTGSVHLFTLFNIRVRAHASLIVLIALILLLGWAPGSSVQERVQGLSILFIVILLHEFGHCFGARATGGEADEIMMTPLGGLAFAMARRNWWSTFVTVASGPLVNVVICLICGAGLFFIYGYWPLGPWGIRSAYHELADGWLNAGTYFFWIYSISYALLIFNMMPVFPLDGGQLLQSVLWKYMGYYRSMMLTLNISVVGSVIMAMVGIAMIATGSFGVLVLLIAIMCFMNSYRLRAMMRAEGPWGFSEYEESGLDYSASLADDRPKKRRGPLSGWKAKRVAKLAGEEANERRVIDAILA
jgi:Zn-dependent protease